MGSWLECEKDPDHKSGRTRYEFLKSVADRKPLRCKKCDGELTYKTTQVWPSRNNHEEKFVLEDAHRVQKVKTQSDNYAPFLLKLRNQEGEYTYWLQYWVYTMRKGSDKKSWNYGQYAPQLDNTQMKSLAKLL
jgi:hypothetical protein